MLLLERLAQEATIGVVSHHIEAIAGAHLLFLIVMCTCYSLVNARRDGHRGERCMVVRILVFLMVLLLLVLQQRICGNPSSLVITAFGTVVPFVMVLVSRGRCRCQVVRLVESRLGRGCAAQWAREEKVRGLGQRALGCDILGGGLPIEAQWYGAPITRTRVEGLLVAVSNGTSTFDPS